MSFGGGGSPPSSTTSTVTNTQELSPEQKQLISMVTPVAQHTLNNAQAYPGPRVQGFSPEQEYAQSSALGVANSLEGFNQNVARANQFALGPMLFADSNPYLQSYMQAAARPLERAFTQNVLPGISQEANQAGQFGGSRQGVAEGIASQGYMQTLGDTFANIANQGYQGGLETFGRALALAPQTAGMQLMPSQIYEGVGAQRQAQGQNVLNAQQQQYYDNLLFPLSVAQNVAGLAFGVPGGTGVSSMTGPSGIQRNNPLTGALGGASAGLGLSTALGMSGPVGAGIGALIGLFG